MKIGRTLLVAAALTLCGTSAALAGTKIMASAPAQGAYPTLQTMFCDIVNLNTTQKNVSVEIRDYFGNIIVGPVPTALPPNTGFAVPDFSGNGAWCRFEVDGSTKKYRAIAIYDNGTNYTVVVPAQ